MNFSAQCGFAQRHEAEALATDWEPDEPEASATDTPFRAHPNRAPHAHQPQGTLRRAGSSHLRTFGPPATPPHSL
jgi:hypothetical protein